VTAGQRLAMVRLATAGNPRFSVDAAEVEAARPSYSVPTLERLRQADRVRSAAPAGAAARCRRLQRPAEMAPLASRCSIWRTLPSPIAPASPSTPAAAPRRWRACYHDRFCASPALLTESPAGRIVTFAMTQLAISATRIRTLLASGGSARYLLPDDGAHLYSQAWPLPGVLKRTMKFPNWKSSSSTPSKTSRATTSR
jgi:nicotinate-nucleotide adenylyltransferase